MTDPIQAYLETDDAELEARWEKLQEHLQLRFGSEKPGIEGILFLIGIRTRGRGYEPDLAKEAKQDLIMEGTYCAFETLGLYTRVGADADGQIQWRRTGLRLPKLPVEAQEKLLRLGILRYFEDLYDL